MSTIINNPDEHTEQVTLFRWTDFAQNSPDIPIVIVQGRKMSVLDFMHAIPNGGYRSKKTACMLKAEGVKSGVPDISLPYPCNGYHGLYIELKRRKNGNVSDNQKMWIDYLKSQGYAACVCKGFEEARQTVIDYLRGHLKNDA